MWIAKPIDQLSRNEVATWLEIEAPLPLSQKLCWARAIEAVHGQSFLVFSPDEKVGGFVFNGGSTSGEGGFECVNGPALNWDDSNHATRQIATFAQAVSRLSPQFESLTCRPRWQADQLKNRLAHLPIAPTKISEASTLVIPLQQSPSHLQDPFKNLSPRLQRTLKKGAKYSIQTQCEKATPSLLKQFVPPMQAFASQRGFHTPPFEWFDQLTRQHAAPEFWLITASAKNGEDYWSRSQVLVCLEKKQGSYLFGYETRAEGIPSSLSTSAAAQWQAIQLCIQKEIPFYDLNGFVDNPEPDHPYAGVCEFKRQFNGKLIQYSVPEFVIA